MLITIVTVVAILIILILLLVNIFHRRLINASLILLNVFFVILIVAALAALFLPDVFKQITDSVLSSTALATQLKYLDTTLSSVGGFSSGILDSIGQLFNPSTTQAQYQSQLYPQLVELFSDLVRWVVLIGSIILMTLITYIRFSFAGLSGNRELERKYHELSERVERLEGVK